MSPLPTTLALYRNIKTQPTWCGFDIGAETDLTYKRGHFLSPSPDGTTWIFHAYASLSNFADLHRSLESLDLDDEDNLLVPFVLTKWEGTQLRRLDRELVEMFAAVDGCRGVGMSSNQIIAPFYARTVLDFTSTWTLSPLRNPSRHSVSSERHAVFPYVMYDLLRAMTTGASWGKCATRGSQWSVYILPMVASPSADGNESDASSSTTEADALTKASNTLGDSASQPIILTDDEVPYPPETPGRSRISLVPEPTSPETQSKGRAKGKGKGKGAGEGEGDGFKAQ